MALWWLGMQQGGSLWQAVGSGAAVQSPPMGKSANREYAKFIVKIIISPYFGLGWGGCESLGRLGVWEALTVTFEIPSKRPPIS